MKKKNLISIAALVAMLFLSNIAWSADEAQQPIAFGLKIMAEHGTVTLANQRGEAFPPDTKGFAEDVPVILSASPNEGFYFVKWVVLAGEFKSLTPGLDSDAMVVTLKQDTTVKAIFAKKTEWAWVPGFSVYGDTKNFAGNFSLAGAFRHYAGDIAFHGQGNVSLDYFRYKTGDQSYDQYTLAFSVLGDIGMDCFRIGTFLNGTVLKVLDYSRMSFAEVGVLARLKFDWFSARAYLTQSLTEPFIIGKGESHYMFEDYRGVWMRFNAWERWVKQWPTVGGDLTIIPVSNFKIGLNAWAINEKGFKHYQLGGEIGWRPTSGLELSPYVNYTVFPVQDDHEWLYIPNIPFPGIIGSSGKIWTFGIHVNYQFGSGSKSYQIPQMPMFEQIPRGPIEAWMVRTQQDEWVNNPFSPGFCVVTGDDCNPEKYVKICPPGGKPSFTYEADWRDGTVVSGTFDTGLELKHKYTVYGTYDFTITMTDSLGMTKILTQRFVYKDCRPLDKPEVWIKAETTCNGTKITWGSKFCNTSLDITPIIGNVLSNPNGSQAVNITVPTTFTIVGYNQGLEAHASVLAKPPRQPVTLNFVGEEAGATANANNLEGLWNKTLGLARQQAGRTAESVRALRNQLDSLKPQGIFGQVLDTVKGGAVKALDMVYIVLCHGQVSFSYTDCDGVHNFSQQLGGGVFNFVRTAYGTGSATLTFQNGGLGRDYNIFIKVNGIQQGEKTLVKNNTTGTTPPANF